MLIWKNAKNKNEQINEFPYRLNHINIMNKNNTMQYNPIYNQKMSMI